MFRLTYSKQSVKTLSKMQRHAARRIRDKIEQIATNPYADHQNVTKLQSREGYRLRTGDWRVLYEIQDDQMMIVIVKIGPRGQIYR